MELLIVLVVVAALVLYFRKPARIPRTFDGVPDITPDMIHPRGVPLARQDAAMAYRDFCIRYLGSDPDLRRNTDVKEFLDLVSRDIEHLEGWRDETAAKAKAARKRLHEAREALRAAPDQYGNKWERKEVVEADAELRRHIAELDAQNAVIDGKKADCRAFLVELLNGKLAYFREISGSPIARRVVSTSDDAPSEMHDTPPDYDYFSVKEQFVRKVDLKLRIRYQKTSGQIDERDFDLREFQRGDEGYALEGYCHLRNAERSLVSQGVLHCIDRETGEIIDNLPAYIEKHYNGSPAAVFDAMVIGRRDELTALLYFAAADGTIRPAEHQILIDYILGLMPAGGPSAAEVRQSILDWYPPGKGAFWDAVKNLAAESIDRLPIVIEAAERLKATDDESDIDEGRALAYMRKKLPKPKRRRSTTTT